MTTYRIRDWGQHFENNRTRELKELRFVILPNKHDGDGYTELLDHPNGAAHYGAWVALVQVSSKGKHPAEGCDNSAGCCECRGALLREGAKPHDPTSLSRLTRIPTKVFEEALPRLAKIGWLDLVQPEVSLNPVVTEIPHPPAESSTAQSGTPLRKSDEEWKGMEGNGTEGNSLVAQARLVFEFWQEHMKHPRANMDDKRGKAIKQRLKDGYTVADLQAAIRGCKLTPFNMGQNERQEVYDGIDLICRDADHVDRFIRRAGVSVPTAEDRQAREARMSREKGWDKLEQRAS